MSEETKPKTLSRAEACKRIMRLTLLSLGAPFGAAPHRLLDECIGLQRAEQKAEDEQDDKHITAVALEQLAQGQKRSEEKIDAAHAAADRAADTSERIEAETAYLYEYRKRTEKKHREQGTAVQENAKADDAERQRAAKDIKEALERVHGRASHGETNIISICRRYCDWTDGAGRIHKGRFRGVGSKRPSGEYAEYEPLKGADGKPIKPETLARYYRDKFSTAKKRKANAAANRARTQAARDAKAAKHRQPTRRT